MSESRKLGQYLLLKPQHVVFAEVGVDQVTVLIQALHQLQEETERLLGKD